MIAATRAKEMRMSKTEQSIKTGKIFYRRKGGGVTWLEGYLLERQGGMVKIGNNEYSWCSWDCDWYDEKDIDIRRRK